jgi:hypothetical protein
VSKSTTFYLVLLIVGFFLGFVGTGISNAVDESINGASDRNRQSIERAGRDLVFCHKYCDAVRGELIEIRNSPTTLDAPALAPVCVCAIDLPVIDTN